MPRFDRAANKPRLHVHINAEKNVHLSSPDVLQHADSNPFSPTSEATSGAEEHVNPMYQTENMLSTRDDSSDNGLSFLEVWADGKPEKLARGAKMVDKRKESLTKPSKQKSKSSKPRTRIHKRKNSHNKNGINGSTGLGYGDNSTEIIYSTKEVKRDQSFQRKIRKPEGRTRRNNDRETSEQKFIQVRGSSTPDIPAPQSMECNPPCITPKETIHPANISYPAAAAAYLPQAQLGCAQLFAPSQANYPIYLTQMPVNSHYVLAQDPITGHIMSYQAVQDPTVMYSIPSQDPNAVQAVHYTVPTDQAFMQPLLPPCPYPCAAFQQNVLDAE